MRERRQCSCFDLFTTPWSATFRRSSTSRTDRKRSDIYAASNPSWRRRSTPRRRRTSYSSKTVSFAGGLKDRSPRAIVDSYQTLAEYICGSSTSSVGISTMTSTDQPGTEDWGEWWPEAWAQRELDNASSEAPSGVPSEWWSAPRLPPSRPRPRKPFGYQDIAEAVAVADENS